MTKMYHYRSIKKISKKGIWFDDGFFLDFELSRIIWAKNHNILVDETHCVAERDITAKIPYFEFYSREATSQADMFACPFGDCREVFDFDNHDHVVVYYNRIFLNNWHKHFQSLRFTIEKMGYTTYDLS